MIDGVVDARDRDVARPQRLAQPLRRLLGLEPQRVVGLHAQHQVHAALEVEPSLSCFSISHAGDVMPYCDATIG